MQRGRFSERCFRGQYVMSKRNEWKWSVSGGGGGCIYIYIYICAWGPIYGLPIKKNIRSFPQRTQLFPPKGESSVEVRRYSDAIGSAVSVWISMRAFVTPDLHRIPWESLGWDDLCEFDMGFSMGCWWMLMDVDGFWWNCIRDQWDTNIKIRDFSIN